MSPMIESLEGRQFFSVSLTPAAPSPIAIPYPNTVEASAKVHVTEIHVVKTTDVASAK